MAQAQFSLLNHFLPLFLIAAGIVPVNSEMSNYILLCSKSRYVCLGRVWKEGSPLLFFFATWSTDVMTGLQYFCWTKSLKVNSGRASLSRLSSLPIILQIKAQNRGDRKKVEALILYMETVILWFLALLVITRGHSWTKSQEYSSWAWLAMAP